EQHRARL
ncbi:hypothetical protein D018_2996B, partial [Vibrio parahaemolyticus VP2007-007]